MSLRQRLVKRARRAGLAPTDAVISGLEQYFELLRKWNDKISLTSLPLNFEADKAIDRLLIEPLLALKHFPPDSARLLDVGSGGGSPAIPLKIALPAISLVMVESKTRKAAFLRDAVRNLSLAATDVETIRLEQLLTKKELCGAADVITMRAVRSERKMLTALQLLLRPGGRLLIFRTGPGSGQEDAIPALTLRASHLLMPETNSYLAKFEKTG